ncbi:ribose-phosphate pyrophosphokinase [Methanolinea mesophila]|uniref:ribose-phosphate diphosphokinase n=1 Tax=Methanolinea mesophila TaxID=547055 RepID=UPI001AE8F600|nr:ribose-phosphate diphosphokinase [Methanolinea mesophila]MBP1927988.1 ribose-phosphate pyrophosphokinase [Methanolinea mesophila]
MRVISTESSQILAARLAGELGCSLVDVRFSRFPDGELYLRAGQLDERTVVVGSVTSNDDLVQLLLLLDACRESSCTLAVPYMGYARQDKQFHPGEPLSARAIARALSTVAEEVITVNIHEESVLDHFTIPARNISLAEDVGEYLKAMGLADPLVLAPDEGAARFGKAVAQSGRWDADHLQKTRHSGEEVTMKPKSLCAEGRTVVIVDDIISTGGTLATAAGMLADQGARSIHAVCVHGVLSGGAYTHLRAAGILDVACSDTIERGCSCYSAAKRLAAEITA